METRGGKDGEPHKYGSQGFDTPNHTQHRSRCLEQREFSVYTAVRMNGETFQFQSLKDSRYLTNICWMSKCLNALHNKLTLKRIISVNGNNNNNVI